MAAIDIEETSTLSILTLDLKKRWMPTTSKLRSRILRLKSNDRHFGCVRVSDLTFGVHESQGPMIRRN